MWLWLLWVVWLLWLLCFFGCCGCCGGCGGCGCGGCGCGGCYGCGGCGTLNLHRLSSSAAAGPAAVPSVDLISEASKIESWFKFHASLLFEHFLNSLHPPQRPETSKTSCMTIFDRPVALAHTAVRPRPPGLATRRALNSVSSAPNSEASLAEQFLPRPRVHFSLSCPDKLRRT